MQAIAQDREDRQEFWTSISNVGIGVDFRGSPGARPKNMEKRLYEFMSF